MSLRSRFAKPPPRFVTPPCHPRRASRAERVVRGKGTQAPNTERCLPAGFPSPRCRSAGNDNHLLKEERMNLETKSLETKDASNSLEIKEAFDDFLRAFEAFKESND